MALLQSSKKKTGYTIKFKKINSEFYKKLVVLKGQTLHAKTLEFIHPTKNKKVNLVKPFWGPFWVQVGVRDESKCHAICVCFFENSSNRLLAVVGPMMPPILGPKLRVFSMVFRVHVGVLA